MKRIGARAVIALAALALAGCNDTLIGPFIEPTHELASVAELEKLGVSLTSGSPNNPKAICARGYDREFAPLGEHYRLENWGLYGPSQAFLEAGLNTEAIIDVDTGVNDYGQVALVWKADGKRLKIYIIDQMDAAAYLPEGCKLFGEP